MRGISTTSESITRKDTISINKYLQDLSIIPLLNADQEYELSYQAFEENDENARQKLITHNLRFVVSVAKQYQTKDLAFEDIINEGNIGLIIASQKFDPSKGFKFISYAVWWVRRNIMAFISEHSNIIRLPANKTTANYKILQRCKRLEQQLQREPCFHDIITHHGDEFTEDDVLFYFESLYDSTASLDKNLSESKSSDTLCNMIQDDKVIRPTHFVNQLDEKYERQVILNYLENDLERNVIKLLYGMDGKEPTTLKTTGFLLGLSSERIRQIRDKALNKLKSFYLKKGKK